LLLPCDSALLMPRTSEVRDLSGAVIASRA
jgi:hypothetical protein